MADNLIHTNELDDDPDTSTGDKDGDVVTKWMCEYCTYANYPSAIKCVMCKGQKPVLDIFRLNSKNLATTADNILDSEQHLFLHDQEDQHQENDDDNDDLGTSSAINSKPPLPSSPPQSQIVPIESSSCCNSSSSSGKWPCAVCTYLNWPIALRCTQCLTERDHASSPLLDATHAEEDLLTAAAEHLQRTLTLRARSQTPPELVHNTAVSQGAIVRRKQVPQQQLQQSPINTTTMTTTCASSVIKWQCQECTYENFPKSQKCSMCGAAGAVQVATAATARPKSNCTSPETATNTTTIINNYNINNNMNLNNNTTNSNKCSKANYDHSKSRSNSSSPARISPIAASGGISIASIIDTDAGIMKNQQLIQNNNNNSLNMESNNAAGIYNYYQEATATTTTTNNNSLARNSDERQLLRKLRKHGDWRWLHACLGIVENNFAAVEEYLSYGGSPGRALTAAEVSLLNRNSAFDVGFTLIHLAIRFQREDMLPMMLAQVSGTPGAGIKRVPSYVAPDLAAGIRRQFSTLLRISRKGAGHQFNCHYVQEHATFALPSEIEDLPVAVQEQLYEELLDRDAQKQLENPPPVLNWSLEITVRLGSRLVALWNRSAGDCLLDSTMQATWGIFDRDNVLRRALADSLHQCAHLFYPRWKEYEMIQASLMHFQLEEAQWQRDWANLLALASQPGASLEQLHIFALAHIFRRPIVVYGVKLVKSFRGEDIGLARFEGVYLPLLWEPSFCTRSPIALGYTRGHFSALVPTESYSSRLEASSNDEEDVTFLPLMDSDMKLLPIHFINETEMGREESLMRQWLDVCMTEGGLMVAQQRLNQRPLLVAQMIEEWLNYYRRLAQVFTAPFARRPQHQLTGYSSDGDTEED